MSKTDAMTPRERGKRGPAPTLDVTLRDVARQADVSPATVSRVFSGHAPVRETTRTRVLQVAGDLGYVASGLAHIMVGARRRALVLVAAELDTATAEIVNAVEAVCTDDGHPLILGLTHHDKDREQSIIENAREQHAIGVILVAPVTTGKEAAARLDAHAAALAAVGVPLVLCGQPAPADHPIPSPPTPEDGPAPDRLLPTDGLTLTQASPTDRHTTQPVPTDSLMAGQSIVSGGPGIAYVTLDYADAARRLVEHLTANGYRRIALVGPVNTLVGAQFVAGCRAGLKGADPSAGSASQDSDPVTGANAHQPLIATCANDVTGAQLAALLLMNHPTMKPDALICLSDDIALGACQAARDLEAAIPDAVAVASFGAAAHTAELSPSLTTVAAPYHDLGVTAARLVLNREPATTTATTTTQVTLPVEVILRESTMRSPTD